jgi:trans-aconitate methyltransferase
MRLYRTMSKKNQDYHDYVIKDGELIADFDNMYKNCSDPWPENEMDMNNNCASLRLKQLITQYNFSKVLSLGSGKGNHLDWLTRNLKNSEVTGVEISRTAVIQSRKDFPKINFISKPVLDYLQDTSEEFDIIIIRECIWYLLDELDEILSIFREKYAGAYLAIELTFYNDQKYGLESFSGMDDFINKYQFQIIELVKNHKSKNNSFDLKSGYLMLFSKI